MQRRLRGILICLCIAVVWLQAAPKPLLVLLDGSAWFPSAGPSVVVYADGTIVYQKSKEILVRERHNYAWVKAFSYMTARVPDATAFIRGIFPDEWTALKSRYELSEATDQVTTEVWHRGQIIEIYGDWRRFLNPDHFGDLENGPQMVERENKLRGSLPDSFRKLLQSLDSYTDAKATPWFPEAVEVSLYRYDRPFANAVPWPPDFPRIDLIKRSSNPIFISGNVVLSAKYVPDFLELLSRTSSPGVVFYEGSNFIVSNFTFQFPAEGEWKRDFAKKAERERADLLESLKKLPPERQKEMKELLGL